MAGAQVPAGLGGSEVSAIAADVLLLVGLVVMTLGVVGLFRMPDTYTRLHATSKAVFLGVIAFLVAALAAGDGAIANRALLIAVFLILTTPVGAHLIARAAFMRGEAMKTPGAIDESGRDLPERSAEAPSPDPPGS